MSYVTWVPPEMAKEGVTAKMLSVLLDTEKPPEARKLPAPQASVVYDRDGYCNAIDAGLIVIHRTMPGFASLSDHFILTEEGSAMVKRYRDAVRALGGAR